MTKRITIAAVAVSSVIASCDTQNASNSERRAQFERQAQEVCATEPAAKLRAVLQQLHRENESEIRLGNLASDRTTSPDVRQYATRMVSEHAVLDQKLVDLAKREQIELAAVPPSDPIHAAATRLVVDQEGELETMSRADFEVAYVTSQSERHNFTLKVIDEGLRVASGDLKSLLDGAHDTASHHREQAILLLQNLRFPSRAIGGGPSSRTSSEDRDQPARGPRRVDDPMAMDGGAWPPVTSPPDIMLDPR